MQILFISRFYKVELTLISISYQKHLKILVYLESIYDVTLSYIYIYNPQSTS